MNVRERLLGAVSFEAIPEHDPAAAALAGDPRARASRQAARSTGFRPCGLVRRQGHVFEAWVHRDRQLSLTICDDFYMFRSVTRSGERVVTFSHASPSAQSTERMLVRPGRGSFDCDLNGHRVAASRLPGPLVAQDSTAAWIDAERVALKDETLPRLAIVASPLLAPLVIYLLAGVVGLLCALLAQKLELVSREWWYVPFLATSWPFVHALKGTTTSRGECRRDTERALGVSA